MQSSSGVFSLYLDWGILHGNFSKSNVGLPCYIYRRSRFFYIYNYIGFDNIFVPDRRKFREHRHAAFFKLSVYNYPYFFLQDRWVSVNCFRRSSVTTATLQLPYCINNNLICTRSVRILVNFRDKKISRIAHYISLSRFPAKFAKVFSYIIYSIMYNMTYYLRC